MDLVMPKFYHNSDADSLPLHSEVTVLHHVEVLFLKTVKVQQVVPFYIQTIN